MSSKDATNKDIPCGTAFWKPGRRSNKPLFGTRLNKKKTKLWNPTLLTKFHTPHLFLKHMSWHYRMSSQLGTLIIWASDIHVNEIMYKSISPTFMYHLVLHKFFQSAPSFCPPQNMPFAQAMHSTGFQRKLPKEGARGQKQIFEKHAPPTRMAPTRSRGLKPRPVA